MKTNRFLVVFLFTLVTICPILPSFADEAAAPVRRALLIGINEYLTDDFSNLRGAVRDVEMLQEVLTGRLGFAPENVKVLTDSAATREGILAAFAELARRASPQDIIYVHFSGHGSQVQDFDGDEKDDGFDETIVPHDARTDGIADITDDEIGAFLSGLRAEAAVIVLDACHSGTATRGAIRTRSVPVDSRLELYRRPSAAAAKTVTSRAIVQLDKPERYVLLTGAASHQSALDGPVGGDYVGFFSYAFSQALANSDLDASPRDLHASIKQTFRQLSEQFGGLMLPEPQVEAAEPRLNAPLFTRGVAVVESGVMVPTQSMEMPTASMEMPTGPATGSGMPGMEASSSTMPPQMPPQMPTLAMPTAEPIGLIVGWSRVDEGLRADLESKIRQHAPDARFAGADEPSRFIVEFAEGRCRVYDAGGVAVVLEFPLSTVDDTAERLATLFARSSKASTLVAMTNPSSRLRIEARVMGSDSGPLRIRQPESKRTAQNSLMIELQASADSYVTIVDVDAEGGVNLLFPNNYTRDGFLPQGFVQAGQTTRIPDSYQPGNRAGFFWDYMPPVGLDTIQVFAHTDQQEAEVFRAWFRDGSAPPSSRGASVGKPGTLERLEGLREAIRTNVFSRGVGVVADVPATVSNTMTAMPNAAPNSMPANHGTASTAPLPGSNPATDWNSASIRIRVEP